MTEAQTREYRTRAHAVAKGFIALAIVAGPIKGYVFPTFFSAMHWQMLAGSALSSVCASIALLLVGAVRRQRMLRAKEWLALLMLLLPQLFALPLTAPYIRVFPWLHETGWGVVFLLSLAAPLWLGLLSAMQIVSVEVPRATIAAAIAGMGAVCLVIPTNAFRIALNQVPVLLAQLSLGILVVFTWAYTAPRLAEARTFILAGSYLLLSAASDLGLWLVYERRSWHAVDWRAVALPLLADVALAACVWWLWFWLLQRMSLAAFGMRALAMWAATTLPGFLMFGFMSWRIDVALAIAVAGIVVALRASTAEEQPMALGLGNK